jgi:hypothetical protein
MRKDAAGMRGIRARNKGSELRDKRDDTRAVTIEEQCNRDFGVRGDMHLDRLLEKFGKASFNDLIHSNAGRKRK